MTVLGEARPRLGIAILEPGPRSVKPNIRDLSLFAAADGQLSGQLRLGATGSSYVGAVAENSETACLKSDTPQIRSLLSAPMVVSSIRGCLTADLDAAIIPRPSFAIPKGF